MAIPLYIAKTKGIDVTVFGFTYMLYPAMSVIIRNLIYNDNNQLIKFYIMYFTITITYIMLSISSLFIIKDTCEILNYILLVVGSLSCYILLKRCNNHSIRVIFLSY